MFKKMWTWLDAFNKLSPLEKAEVEWEQTKAALLDSLSHEEYYRGLSNTLKAREARLKAYCTQETV